jgi:hypothetical protein
MNPNAVGDPGPGTLRVLLKGSLRRGPMACRRRYRTAGFLTGWVFTGRNAGGTWRKGARERRWVANSRK